MIEEAHDDFKRNNPTIKLTYKKKAHGEIVYVDEVAAYNMDDMFSFNTYEKQYKALENTLNRSKNNG